MGIFDRGGKKAPAHPAAEDGDFADSPVEQVQLNAPTPAARPAPAPVEEARPSFNIDDAIKLMRNLPVDQNVELVVQVIKTTLESLRVRVTDIITDASKKQRDLEARVATLRQQISDFEKEIQQRKEEIGRLEADHAETTGVKARLELAEKMAGSKDAKKA